MGTAKKGKVRAAADSNVGMEKVKEGKAKPVSKTADSRDRLVYDVLVGLDGKVYFHVTGREPDNLRVPGEALRKPIACELFFRELEPFSDGKSIVSSSLFWPILPGNNNNRAFFIAILREEGVLKPHESDPVTRSLVAPKKFATYEEEMRQLAKKASRSRKAPKRT